MVAKMSGLRLDRSLLRAGERLCVAVSGGADSVALLVGLVEEKAALGIGVSAAHVQHGLRGVEADGDEVFVRELCGRMGVPLTVFRVDTAGRQAAEGEGVEEAARELRYAALRGLMERGEADVVATAHTLDDQAETVVMKLLRGAWVEGLGGISPEVQGSGDGAASEAGLSTALRSGRDDTFGMGAGEKQILRFAKDDKLEGGGFGGRIVRPLLRVRRREVEAFLRERGLGWREDASNADVSLTRNRVRHELMPMLRSFNPAVDEMLANVAELARDDQAYWEAEIGRLLPMLLLPGKPVRGGGRGVGTVVGEAEMALELERLKGLSAAVRRRVVRAAARSVGCRLSFEETAKVLALAGFGGFEGVKGKVGSRLELGKGLRVVRSARELRLWRRT
jgi:tRNA(Ile)-lysidine synthase